jgi:hypothetical protein
MCPNHEGTAINEWRGDPLPPISQRFSSAECGLAAIATAVDQCTLFPDGVREAGSRRGLLFTSEKSTKKPAFRLC